MQFDNERTESMNGNRRTRMRGLAALAALAGWAALAGSAALAVGSAEAAHAQPLGNSQGWAPYLGCWEPQDAATDGVLCFVEGREGMEMITVLDGEIAYREPFRTDGQPHAVEQEDCRGDEAAWFSDDQKRIYTVSDMACDGEAGRRTTGIISSPERGRWLDVRATEVNGTTMAWSRWYRRADDRVLEEAGGARAPRTPIFGAGAPNARTRNSIAVADVVDASRNVHAKAVAAWVAEVGQEFRGLDAGDLLRLEAEGVEDDVIDVVVAVSFPEHFSLNDGAPADAPDGAAWERSAHASGRFGHFGYDPFYWGYSGYYGYSPFWGSRYGYGPGAYYYGGRWSGGYGYVPVQVDVRPRSERGRVVAGEGYRRGARDPGSDAPSYRPRPGTTGSTVGGAGGRTSQSPPARGGSTGRKAKPRGGK